MSDDDKGSGSSKDSSQAADAAKKKAEQDAADARAKADPEFKKVVEHPLYVETRADLLKEKDENKALKSRLAKIDADQKAADDKALLEQNKFKELSEKKTIEATTLAEENKKIRIQSEVKLQAVLAGIRDEDDKNLEGLEGVTVENGIVKGAKEAIAALKEKKAHLFGDGKPAPGSRETKPGAKGDESVTYAELMADKTGRAARFKQDHPAEYRKMKDEHFKSKGR